jgi:ankyrin repeat protein
MKTTKMKTGIVIASVVAVLAVGMLLRNGGKASAEELRIAKQAACTGDMDTLHQFVEKYPSIIRQKDDEGDILLHWAAANGQAEACEYLIKAGSNVNARGNRRDVSLHWAAATGDMRTIAVLLDNRAEVNARDEAGTTAYTIAVERGNPLIIMPIAEAGGTK